MGGSGELGSKAIRVADAAGEADTALLSWVKTGRV